MNVLEPNEIRLVLAQNGGTQARALSPVEVEHARTFMRDEGSRYDAEAARDRVGIDAGDMRAEGGEHAGERDLRADAITVGSSMADDRDPPPMQALQ